MTQKSLNINDLSKLYEMASYTSTTTAKLIQEIEESSIKMGAAMFNCINELITDELFALQVWDSGYGRNQGVWIALGSEDNQIDYFRDMLLAQAGDDFIDTAIDLILATNWLPYVFDKTMIGAMVKLESRLASLPGEERIRVSDWTEMLICAVNDLKAIHKAYNENEKLGTSTVLGKQFNEALEIITDRYGPWPRENRLLEIARQFGPYKPID